MNARFSFRFAAPLALAVSLATIAPAFAARAPANAASKARHAATRILCIVNPLICREGLAARSGANYCRYPMRICDSADILSHLFCFAIVGDDHNFAKFAAMLPTD